MGIYARKKGTRQAEAKELSEDGLINLLHKTSHAGVLLQSFVRKLHAKVEIRVFNTPVVCPEKAFFIFYYSPFLSGLVANSHVRLLHT
jgi:hypothetical protein